MPAALLLLLRRRRRASLAAARRARRRLERTSAAGRRLAWRRTRRAACGLRARIGDEGRAYALGVREQPLRRRALVELAQTAVGPGASSRPVGEFLQKWPRVVRIDGAEGGARWVADLGGAADHRRGAHAPREERGELNPRENEHRGDRDGYERSRRQLGPENAEEEDEREEGAEGPHPEEDLLGERLLDSRAIRM